jgi:hypothetical protein
VNDNRSSAAACASDDLTQAFVGANCGTDGPLEIDRTFGIDGMIDWAVENRSTLLAIGGAVVCTAAAAPTAGGSILACKVITGVTVANATVNTGMAVSQCGWESGVTVAVFEYSAAMPGLAASVAPVRAGAAVAGGHGGFFAVLGDMKNVGSC